MLANYLLTKLTNEAFLDLSYTAEQVEFLPNNIAMLDKQLQLQITNNSEGFHYNQDTLPI